MQINEVSRYIPASVKRAVRQNCRFGCVICGIPVYHYDHIEEFVEVQEHSADNIVLLCPTHHQDKTSNRLPKAILYAAQSKPFNSGASETAKHRWYFADVDVDIQIGSCGFTKKIGEGEAFTAIRLDDVDLATFRKEAGHLLLSVDLRNANGDTFLKIVDSEVSISTSSIDVTMEGPLLTIDPGPSDSKIEIEKRDEGVSVHSGHFFGGYYHVKIHKEWIEIQPGDRWFGNITLDGGRYGINFSRPPSVLWRQMRRLQISTCQRCYR